MRLNHGADRVAFMADSLDHTVLTRYEVVLATSCSSVSTMLLRLAHRSSLFLVEDSSLLTLRSGSSSTPLTSSCGAN